MILFVRCSYHDTNATVTANVPRSITKCSVSLERSAGNRIVGKSEMKCNEMSVGGRWPKSTTRGAFRPEPCFLFQQYSIH